MCNYVNLKSEIDGAVKSQGAWQRTKLTTIYFDHPYFLPEEHTLNIDFFDVSGGERLVGIELRKEDALKLINEIKKALSQDE